MYRVLINGLHDRTELVVFIMKSISRLCYFTLALAVICLHRRTQGLQCYSCSGEEYCKSMLDRRPHRVGRCQVKDGKCFVRRDSNGEVYLGCIDDEFWPDVPWRTYTRRCEEDWERSWVYQGMRRPIVWCLCDDSDDCNVNIGDAGSKPTTIPPTTALDRTTQQPMTTTLSMNTTTNVTSCPADFIQPVGTTSCYKVVSPTLSDVTESRDYVQATTACQSDGAHLVSIESVDEQRHLATILRTQPVILQGWQGWWTSGQLMAGTNLFVWRSSNRPVLIDRSLWGFVQSPIRDTCIWIMSIPYYNYTLGNYDCTTRAGYICEIQLTADSR